MTHLTKYDKFPMDPYALIHYNAAVMAASSCKQASMTLGSTMPAVASAFQIQAMEHEFHANAIMVEAKAQYIDQRGPVLTQLNRQIRLEREAGDYSKADRLTRTRDRLLPAKDKLEETMNPTHHLLFLCRPFFTLLTPTAFNLPFLEEDADTGRYVMQDERYREVNTDLLDENGVLPLKDGPAQVLKRRGDGWEVHLRFGTDQTSRVAFSFTVNRSHVHLGITRVYDALEEVEYSVNGTWDYVLSHNPMFALHKLMVTAGYVPLPGLNPSEWASLWQGVQDDTPLPDYLTKGQGYGYQPWDEKYIEELRPALDGTTEHPPQHVARFTLRLRDRVEGVNGNLPEIIIFDNHLPQYSFDKGENWHQVPKTSLPTVFRLAEQHRARALQTAAYEHDQRQRLRSTGF